MARKRREEDEMADNIFIALFGIPIMLVAGLVSLAIVIFGGYFIFKVLFG